MDHKKLLKCDLNDERPKSSLQCGFVSFRVFSSSLRFISWLVTTIYLKGEGLRGNFIELELESQIFFSSIIHFDWKTCLIDSTLFIVPLSGRSSGKPDKIVVSHRCPA